MVNSVHFLDEGYTCYEGHQDNIAQSGSSLSASHLAERQRLKKKWLLLYCICYYCKITEKSYTTFPKLESEDHSAASCNCSIMW